MSAGQTAPGVPGHRRPIVLQSTGASSCDSKLADDPWAVDRDPGYGPGASAADGVPSSAPRQGPLPERYTRASDEQLDRWAPLASRVNTVEAPGFWLLNLHLGDSGKVDVEYEARFGPQSGGIYRQAFREGSKLGGENALVLAIPNFEETP